MPVVLPIRSRVCGRFWIRACCREGRLPRLPGPWCRKKAVICYEPNEGAYGFTNQRTGVRRTAFHRGGFRDADNEVAMGDGRALAWRFSARIRRWREAPSRKAAMHRSKNEERPASVSSHGWRRREAPRHGFVSLTNRHKKGADLCRVMAEADPEGYHYAAATSTGIPILCALSTRLLVSPAYIDRRCQRLSEYDIIASFQCVME